MAQLYSLLEINSKKQIDDLSFSEVLKTLSALDPNTLKDWYYWQRGMAEWKLITSDPILMSGIEQSRIQLLEETILNAETEILEKTSNDPSESGSHSSGKEEFEIISDTIKGTHVISQEELDEDGDEEPFHSEKTPTELEKTVSLDDGSIVGGAAAETLVEDFTMTEIEKTKTELSNIESSKNKPLNLPPIPNDGNKVAPVNISNPEEKGFRERRRTKRFQLNFRIMVTNGSDSFITFSDNISLGGIKLAHLLPDHFIGQECEVYIMNSESKESVQLACRIVGTPSDPDRISFSGGSAEVVAKLNSWFLELISDEKDETDKAG